MTSETMAGSERKDSATQCDMVAPMVTKFTKCFRKPLSKPSQCVLKMVSHSTQTSESRRVKATVQQMQSPTETEDPVTVAYKYNTLPDQGSPDRNHPTSQCTNSTSSHMGKSLSSKLHKCSQCSKSFRSKYFLDVHVRTHTGERPFHCDYCDSEFTQKCHLNVHVRTHTGERPYCCTYCQKRYAYKCDLVVHMRTHTGDKPYQYQLCPMAFVHNMALLRHVRSHKGEKPFHCNLCQKAFAGRHSLKEHKGKEH